MHHYPFHPGDYMLDTAHLEPMEDLAYRRLLDLYYTSEQPIPTETDLVSRRLRLGSELVLKVLTEFFEHTENGWNHARCDAEIADYRAKAERARVNGKSGGRPKKQATKPSGLKVGSEKKPDHNPEITGSKANQNQNQNQNQEPIIIPPTPKGAKVVEPDWPSDFPETHKPALLLWWKHKREKGKGYKPTGWTMLCNQQRSKSVESLTADVEASIASNYDGLFPAKSNGFGLRKPANHYDIPARQQEIPSEPIEEPANF